MAQNTTLSSSLHFSPILDTHWLWVFLGVGIILFVYAAANYKNGLIFRSITFLVFLFALLNPSVLKETRNYVKDVAVIVVDRSSSQNIEKREERTNIALESLKSQINNMDMFDLRVLEAPKERTLTERTDLFSTLDQSLSDIPQKRRAGVIFLTDGQVHDVPQNPLKHNSYGPVHTLLSGHKNEKDRQIVISHAPAYGLVGKTVDIKYKVEDTKNIGQSHASVTLTFHDGTQKSFYVPVNEEQEISLPLNHPSQNVFTLEALGVDNEITLTNNKTAIIVNGVRDRLKVLLVSGIPHSGERTWRDLLTSDPGVDLVHFTILREPQKYDYTPKNELSLIAFPFKELFEIKLYDFDLIIFDRYRVNNILPNRYFENIVRYVKEGGAFLEASGPAFAGKRSIYRTPLGEILPGKPTGGVTQQKFTPRVADLGHQHPVTKSLVWNNEVIKKDKTPLWGDWLRSIDIQKLEGDVLLNGVNESPLLILNRVGKGRVAQLSSDHIWLWSRGYDGGGPHAELLRRIVHWLMKEPELDERALDITTHKDTITIKKQNYTNKPEETIAVSLPNGEHETITLKDDGKGFLSLKYKAKELGIYAFEDTNGTRKFAIVGNINPPELRGVKTTAEKLQPITKSSCGATIWLDKTAKPKVSSAYKNARCYGGNNWLSLKKNSDFTVTGVKDIPLFHEWMILLILLSAIIYTWWREGQNT